MARRQNQAVREFILQSLPDHPKDIGPLTAKQFNISRTSVSNYLHRLSRSELITGTGNTKAREYRLNPLDQFNLMLPLASETQEHLIWREHMLPHFRDLPENVIGICEYGFNEIMNNIIDHSETTNFILGFERNYSQIRLELRDFGVGIFEKIKVACGFLDRREAILELSKGKLTTAKTGHTGEGIFFTSRMMDQFQILSGDLYFTRTSKEDEEWLIETPTIQDKEFKGTLVMMTIAVHSTRTAAEVLNKFMDDDARFSRTHIPLVLAKYEGESLVSRSQARRLMARVERFSEVILDFRGINEIGQAFADEIFRVYQAAHPNVRLIPIRFNSAVERMITHAKSNAEEQVPL